MPNRGSGQTREAVEGLRDDSHVWRKLTSAGSEPSLPVRTMPATRRIASVSLSPTLLLPSSYVVPPALASLNALPDAS